MKKFIVLAIIALGAGFSACKKEKEIFPNQSEMTTITPPPDQGDSIVDQTKASWILNATSASQIPSQFFKVSTMYKNSYIHMGQPDQTSCSWTSYMLAVGAIARGNGNSYACTPTKVYAIKNACNNSASILKLRDFGNASDNQYITAVYDYGNNSPSGRFTAIKKMLNHIYTYHKPFLVIGTYTKANGTKVGHYLVVHSIDWKCGGTGSTVYYTDCAYSCVNNNSSIDANLRSMDLSLFLNRMIDSPDAYNMLFFY